MQAKLFSLGTIAGLLLTVSSAGAVVIRDDVSDQAYLDLAGSYDNVGHITFNTPDGGYLASGTLISSNWVLTAAHVVDGATQMWWNPNPQGQAYQGYQAVEWISHPKWNGDISRGYDIGLMRFDTDLVAATGINPALLYMGTSEVGSVGTMVGYGTTGTGLTGGTTYDFQKRAGENMIDSLLLTPGKDNRVLLADFDNPNDPSDSSWGSASPLALEGLIAPGDSGGGLFLDVDGGSYLAGVNSFGWGRLDGNPDSDYGDAAGFTRVSSFFDWIMSFIGLNTGGGGSDGGDSGGPPSNRGGGKFLANAVQIPAPGMAGLFGLGLMGLSVMARKRRG